MSKLKERNVVASSKTLNFKVPFFKIQNVSSRGYWTLFLLENKTPKCKLKVAKLQNNESLICPEIVPKVLILTICNLIYFSWQSNHVPNSIIISIVEVIELCLQL